MKNSLNKYYISVDGGASKTEFCVHDLATKKEEFFISGSTNYKNTGTDAEKNLVHDGIFKIYDVLKIEPDQVRGLVMGLAGCDSKEDQDYYMGITGLTGIKSENIYICNDCELAFHSEGKPPGLSVNAGTGSISMGVTADYTTGRSGGWGSLIGDEGSGGWLGTCVIKDLLRYCDGYEEHRNVFDVIRDYIGKKSFKELPSLFSMYTINEIAVFAKIVMDEAEKGDEYCVVLTNRSAELVAEIAYSVYKKLKFDEEKSVDVVMLGGLFISSFYTEVFKQYLVEMVGKENLNFCGRSKRPVMGGIAIAYSVLSG